MHLKNIHVRISIILTFIDIEPKKVVEYVMKALFIILEAYLCSGKKKRIASLKMALQYDFNLKAKSLKDKYL